MRADMRRAQTWNDRIVVLVTWSPMILRIFFRSGLTALVLAGFATLGAICGDTLHMWRTFREMTRDLVNLVLRWLDRPLLPDLPSTPD